VLLSLTACLSFDADFGAITAAQSSRCAPKFSFFPKGGEDRNVPHAWGKTAQMAAGNYKDDILYNVILTSSNNLPGIVAEAVPMLHIAPVHPLLTVGSMDLPASCTGFVAQSAGPDVWASKGAEGTGAGADTAAAADPAAAKAVDVAESAQVGGPADAAAAAEAAAAPEAATPAAAVAAEEEEATTAPAEAAIEEPEAPIEPDAAAIVAHKAAVAAKAATETLKQAVAAAAAAGSNSTAASSSTSSSADAIKLLQPDNSTATNRQLLSSSSIWSGMGGEDESLSAKSVMVSHFGRQLLGGEAVTLPASYRLQYSLNGSEPVDTGDLTPMMSPFHRITLNGLSAYPDVSSELQAWVSDGLHMQ
jgi:hypothetical protein